MPTTLPVELLRLFRGRDLPLPPMPPELAAELEEEGDLTFTAETESGFLDIRLAGYGLQSLRFEYALRVPGLRFRLSLPYGRAFGDPESEKEDLRRGFALARVCLAMAGQAWLTRAGWKDGVLDVDYDEHDCFAHYQNPTGEELHECQGLDPLLDILETSGSAENPADWLRS